MSDVLIMGGGFAGLAAATALAAAGRSVTVLEKRPELGGRAYSYTDQTTGEVIDNGQLCPASTEPHTLDFTARSKCAVGLGSDHAVPPRPKPIPVRMRW